MAIARMIVPNGSPNLCAIVSAWCTAASTEPISKTPAKFLKLYYY